MSFEIVRNDITAVEADAIVNTANPAPIIGAGTDSAIHRKAGPELLAARKKIGDIPIGCSVETPAFGLQAKYVLHTVGPMWIDGAHQEQALLRKAYDSALFLAEKLGCGSVAFPLMASGSYRFPKELALQTAIDAFTSFLMTHEMEILLVVFDRKAFDLSCGLFRDLKSFVDETYVAQTNEAEYAAEYASQNRGFLMQRRLSAAKQRRQEAFEAMASCCEAPGCLPEAAPMPPCARLEELLGKTEPTFNEKLREFLMQHEGKDSQIYGDGAMSRQLFNKIINSKDYNPKKSTVLQLAIGLHLDYEQTQELLGSAGYVLTHSDKRDVIVEYYIRTKQYNVAEIDSALFGYGLACIGKY